MCHHCVCFGFSSDYGLLVFIGLGSVSLGSGSFGCAGCAFTEPVLDFWISRCAITELVWTFGFIRLRFTSADEPGVPSLNRFGFFFLGLGLFRFS